MILDEQGIARVTGAITAAEARTSGEIVCTLENGAHRYEGWLLALAALAAFVLPLLLTFFGFGPERWALLGEEWHVNPGAGAEWRLVGSYALVQAGILLGVTLLLWWSPLAQEWAPRPLRRRRVHEAAVRQFLLRGIDRTRARTGVLLYVSLRDRCVEVVADAAVSAKVPAEHWGETVDILRLGLRRGEVAEALVQALDRVGAILAAHFPPGATAENELPDHLVIL